MSTSTPIPQDHPLMRAWIAHTATPEHANSRSWAQHAEHVEGSLWASFMAGWMAACANAGTTNDAQRRR